MPKSLLNNRLQISTKIVQLIENKTHQTELPVNEIKKIVGENPTENVNASQINKLFFEYISNINNLKNLEQTINNSLDNNNIESHSLEIKKIIQNEIETGADGLKTDFSHPFFDEKAMAAYFALKPIMMVLSKLEGYPFPNYASFKLAALLGSKKDALAYLDNFSKRNNSNATLQSALEISLPEIKSNTINEHRTYIRENLVLRKFQPKFLKLLGEPKDYTNNFNRFNEYKKQNSKSTKPKAKAKPNSIYGYLIEIINIIKDKQLDYKNLKSEIKGKINSILPKVLNEHGKELLTQYLINDNNLKAIISEINVVNLELKEKLALKREISLEIITNKSATNAFYPETLDKEGINTYLSLRPLARLLGAIENSTYPLYYAYKLSVLFGLAKDGVSFLEKFKQYAGKHSLHDATLFNLPTIDSHFDINKLRKASTEILRKRYVPEYVELLGGMNQILAISGEIKQHVFNKNGNKLQLNQYASYLEKTKKKSLGNNKLTATERFMLALDKKAEHDLNQSNKNPNANKEKIKQTLLKKYIADIDRLDVLQFYTRTLSYERAGENLEAAGILSNMKIPEEQFNAYLDFIKQMPLKSSDKILPFCYISGSELGKAYKGYYIIKLSANDPKALFLGYPTGCCQSIGSEGEECAKYGASQENSGFYVLCKGQAPKIGKSPVDTTQLISAKNIVAQSWVWRTFDSNNNKYSNTVVFDSIECSDNMEEPFQKAEIVRNMYQLLAKKLCESSNTNAPIESVHIGQSMGLSLVGYKEEPFSHSLINKEKVEYEGYSDYIDLRNNMVANMVVYDIKEPNLVILLEDTNKLPDKIKQNKFSLHQINLLLKKANKLFEPSEFYRFFMSVIQILPDLVQSRHDLAGIIVPAKDLSQLLKDLSSEERIAVLYTMREYLPAVIKSSSDFKKILKYLSAKERTVVFNAMKEHLPAVIKNSSDFQKILKYLSTKERTVVFNAMKERLPALVDGSFGYSDNPRHFNIVIKYLSSKERTIVFNATKERLLGSIKDGVEFGWVLEYLSRDERAIVFNATKERLLGIIKKGLHFSLVVEYLSRGERTDVLNATKEHLPSIIHDVDDLIHALSPLSIEESTVVLNKMKEHLSVIIRDSYGFQDLIRSLSTEKRTIVLNATKVHLPYLLKDKYQFGAVIDVIGSLSKEERTIVVNATKEGLPNFIKSAERFRDLLEHLSAEQCTTVCQALKEPLSDILKGADYFNYVFEKLNPEQNAAICKALQTHLSASVRDISQLSELLNGLDEKMRTCICGHLPHLNRLVVNAKQDFPKIDKLFDTVEGKREFWRNYFNSLLLDLSAYGETNDNNLNELCQQLRDEVNGYFDNKITAARFKLTCHSLLEKVNVHLCKNECVQELIGKWRNATSAATAISGTELGFFSIKEIRENTENRSSHVSSLNFV